MQQSHGRLHFIHFGVNTRRHHDGFIGKTKVFKIIDALFGFGVVANNGAPFEGIKYLGGVEAQYGQIAIIENAGVILFDAETVGRIVNHLQPIGIGNLLDAFHIARNTVAVDRHDGRRFRRNQFFNAVRIDIKGDRVNIGKHRRQIIPQQAVRGGDKGVRRGDHFAGNT